MNNPFSPWLNSACTAPAPAVNSSEHISLNLNAAAACNPTSESPSTLIEVAELDRLRSDLDALTAVAHELVDTNERLRARISELEAMVE